MVKKKHGNYSIDWDNLCQTVNTGVHFLDNVIDANNYRIPEVEKVTKQNRRIGLGVMGLSDLLCLMGILYDTEKALEEVNWVLEKLARERGFWSEALIEKTAKNGKVRGLDQVPEDIQKVFVTALEIDHEWHVRMQGAFQNHCDNAVSKTINFPMDAPVENVRSAFQVAHQLKCKGITVYPYGSKPEQVLNIGEIERKRQAQTTPSPFVVAESEFAGGCSDGTCPAPS